MISNLRPIWINISKVIIFLLFYYKLKFNLFVFTYCISVTSFTYLLVPYAYVYFGLTDCIPLLSLALNSILLNSSVTTLRSSILNFCYVFNISLLFFMNSLWHFRRLSTLRQFFFLSSLFCFQVELLLNSVYNIQI